MVWTNLEDASMFKYLNLTLSCLSLTGGILMGYFCLRMRPRTIQIKLIMAIATSDFLYSVSNFMSTFEGTSMNALCYTEATIRAFSFVLSIFYATSIGILCYKTADIENALNEQQFFSRTSIIGMCFGTFLALAPTFIPRIEYTNSTIYCFITYAPGSNLATMLVIRILYEGFPVMAGVIVSLAAYIGTVRRLKRLPEGILIPNDTNLNKLFWYPIVLFVLFVPSVIDNFTMIITNQDEPTVLKAIHIVLTHSMGLVNSILYGLQMKLNHLNSKKAEQSRLLEESVLSRQESYIIDEMLIAAGEL